jgi:hypothetical protein
MSQTNAIQHLGRRARFAERGAFAVEFAVVLLVFFAFTFSVIEMARLVYLWNTLSQVSRSAAQTLAVTNFRDEDAKDAIRRNAIFRTSAGTLVLGDPVTDQHLRIDYLSLAAGSSGALTLTPIPAAMLPSCPARNRLICEGNPNHPSCIQFVRVRICDTANASGCDPVPYKSVVSLTNLAGLTLPKTETIMKAESLGYSPGMAMCN